MSDPSLVEAIAVLLGILTVAAGFFVILTKQAYLAGVYASPITPYGSIKGYVSGFNKPVLPISEIEIRETAAKAFLDNLMEVKLQIWLLSITSLFITTYPLTLRLKSSIIPAASITGTPPTSIIWAGLIPVLLSSLGFALVLVGMSVTAYQAYFGVGLSRGLTIVLADLTLYIMAVAILFYGLFIVTGRPEIGILFGFLGALALDRIALSIEAILFIVIILNFIDIAILALALYKRWLAI